LIAVHTTDRPIRSAADARRGDAPLQYFAGAITEDIATDLSRLATKAACVFLQNRRRAGLRRLST
jgi:hypothetical protein